ncbi:Serine-threonine/tyrosine-protein kinase, catalytic domain [Dillenia turbinata]|uniref:non-specific serine/threonine protein kinase n=1 Tax=Dillenia turbinata TaxID=194707 RepID=A0AAN8VR22_9MAGN
MQHLRIIALLGNRLTGPIPKEIGNISTLAELIFSFEKRIGKMLSQYRNRVLESNQLNGTLPPELGNLKQISRLSMTTSDEFIELYLDRLFNSNNFTGPIPNSFAKLTTLMDFRISDNQFTGNVPSFIADWKNIEKIQIQASGLQGPIPHGIFSLTNITDLRISDINGNATAFSSLSNLGNISMKNLVLRNCNLNGTLLDYLGKITITNTLDLSFNKLSGEIPNSSSGLSNVDYMYLTGNLLNGTVPNWMQKSGHIDLSYNNFTVGNSGGVNCQQQSVNLFSTSSNNSGLASCFETYTCPKTFYHLRINCGGEEVNVDGKKYEADTYLAEAATFNIQNTAYHWALSNTGHFMDNSSISDKYIATNTSVLLMENSELYKNARISPISLTYYGFCLKNGNYKVNLHFAEIIFTSDHNYSSLGRRIFDVYIQGKRVLKDFNIENEAGGVGKAIIKSFTSIPVSSKTLEIRFYWAGKGTTAIPDRGVYGPLISAISVDPEFPVPVGMSAGAVVGIVVAVVSVIVLVLGILWWKGCLGRKNTMEEVVPTTILPPKATYFVYKVFSQRFGTECLIWTMFLINEASPTALRGLDLQTGSFNLRQIKAATNNFDAANKIGEGGFGSVYKGLLSDGTIIAVKQLSSKSKQGNREFVNEIGMISALQHPHLVKLYGCCVESNQLLLVYEYMENNSLARALFGNFCYIGYMAPEYAMRGYLTDKADVYSFGIVALETVSGRSNTSYKRKDDFFLLDWALLLKANDSLLDLVDPRLGKPSMSTVVSMLEGKSVIKEFALNSSVSNDEMKLKATEKKRQYIDEEHTRESKGKNLSLDGPWTDSASGSDLYPVNFLDSEFLTGRS